MKKKYYNEKSRSAYIYICMCIQWWIYVCINRLINKDLSSPNALRTFQQSMEIWTSKLFLAANTRLFFAGSSYGMILSKAARIRQRVKSRTKRSDQRSLHHMPLTFEAIQRIKKASLPDGTKYSLSVTWKMDPHFQMIKEVATQKSEDVFKYQLVSRPPWVEKGIQCTTRQPFIFEDWTLGILMGGVS